MKTTVLFCILMLFLWLFQGNVHQAVAQNESNLSIYAMMADDQMPAEASRNLETRLQSLLAEQGMADNQYVERFVLTAKVNILSKNIIPTAPTRISQKMDITFIVGDVIENKLFTTKAITLSGIGETETKAYINAFSKIKSHAPALREMLQAAKKEIVNYYTNNCATLLERANTLSAMQNYDEAIHYLMSVPNLCTDCFLLCQTTAEEIYKQKIDFEATSLLQQARTEWSKQPNLKGANKVAFLINKINPYSSIYPQVEKLREEISNKLQADEQKEWEFQMKKYEDSQTFKQSIVEACRAIGVAWGQGQPQNVTKTVIRGWLW